MHKANVDDKLARRLAAQGIRLVEETEQALVAECIACRAQWPIATGRLGQPHEDEAADWWWCPNGCNRTE